MLDSTRQVYCSSTIMATRQLPGTMCNRIHHGGPQTISRILAVEAARPSRNRPSRVGETEMLRPRKLDRRTVSCPGFSENRFAAKRRLFHSEVIALLAPDLGKLHSILVMQTNRWRHWSNSDP